jgi:uncharacterized repeat protein (TIGR01451 family)
MQFAGALVAGALLALGSVAANAAETAAGTSVSNTATVNYKVGTVSQTAVQSTATFKVDARVLLTVTQQDNGVTAGPGDTSATKFTITNGGNQDQEAILTASAYSGATDPFDAGKSSDFTPTVGVYSDAACTTSISAAITVTTTTPVSVYVCATIPGTQADGSIAVVGLTAQAAYSSADESANSSHVAGTAIVGDNDNAWNATVKQFIFADSTSNATTGDNAYDGYASDLDAYTVQSATLAVSKTSSAVSDPICVALGGCGTTHPAHAIPGATMQYAIKVKNSGSSGASSLDVTDVLPSAVSYIGPIKYNGTTCNGTAGSSPKCVYNAGTIEASSFSLPAATSITISYEVKIP